MPLNGFLLHYLTVHAACSTTKAASKAIRRPNASRGLVKRGQEVGWPLSAIAWLATLSSDSSSLVRRWAGLCVPLHGFNFIIWSFDPLFFHVYVVPVSGLCYERCPSIIHLFCRTTSSALQSALAFMMMHRIHVHNTRSLPPGGGPGGGGGGGVTGGVGGNVGVCWVYKCIPQLVWQKP